jgi:hypothetical protein
MRGKQLAWAALVALSVSAGAQSQGSAGPGAAAPGQPVPAQPPGTPGATLADQCLALLDGRVPANVDPVQLRPRCESLLRAGASGAGAGAPQPAVSQSGVQVGQSVQSSFPPPGREVTGQAPAGQSARGLVSNTLTTNPIGWFSGLGVNADYHHPFEPEARFSYVIRGWYSRVSASNGDVSTFGTGAGADMYMIGGRNEGLRLGPRLVLAFGRESIQGTTDFARLGASGEIGYDFIAASRLSGSVAGGYGGRLAGDASNDNFASFTAGETGPYVTFGVGYSW